MKLLFDLFIYFNYQNLAMGLKFCFTNSLLESIFRFLIKTVPNLFAMKFIMGKFTHFFWIFTRIFHSSSLFCVFLFLCENAIFSKRPKTDRETASGPQDKIDHGPRRSSPNRLQKSCTQRSKEEGKKRKEKENSQARVFCFYFLFFKGC